MTKILIMKLKLVFAIYCLFFITACQYGTGMNGKVIDEETGLPISNATVNLLNGKDIKRTNNKGYFTVFVQTGIHKIDPIVEISKKGYKPFQIQFSSEDDKNTYSVKSEYKWIDYDSPLYFNSKDSTSYIIGTDIEKWSQHFSVDDTIIFYLTKDDEKTEIEKIKSELLKTE